MQFLLSSGSVLGWGNGTKPFSYALLRACWKKAIKLSFRAFALFRNYPQNQSSQLQEYLINTGKIQDVGSDYA
jgi:hypothetical protein